MSEKVIGDVDTGTDYKETRSIDLHRFRENIDCMTDVSSVMNGLVYARQWVGGKYNQASVTALNSVAKLLIDLVGDTYESRKYKVEYTHNPVRDAVFVEADSQEDAISKARPMLEEGSNIVGVEEVA